MAIKKYKPTSPGRRFATYADNAEVTKTEPEKSLVEGLKKSGGRNTHGRITSRHRGGGAKRKYRKIDFKRRKDGKLVVWGETKASGKTKELAAQFKKLGWGSVLVIDGPEVNEQFAKAARNIPNVDVLPQQGANVYDILRRDTLVLTKAAVEHLVERLK